VTTVALVLGAGGAVGHAFHVGVLSALADEFGWDARAADLIVGTSAGSVVGASLRVGLDPLDMRRRLFGQKLSPAGAVLTRRGEAAMAAVTAATVPGSSAGRPRIASSQRVRRAVREPWKVTPGSLFSALAPPGRVPTDHLGAAYDDLLGDEWPDRPLWLPAVDLDIGHRVVFGREGAPPATLGQAVEASCAIPGYFSPVTIDDSRYVDGAVQSTTNADLVAAFEAAPGLAVISAPMSAVGRPLELGKLSMRPVAKRSLAREAKLLRDRDIEVITFQPTPADLAVMAGGSNVGGGAGRPGGNAGAVCRQIVESTLNHVRTPAIADRLSPLGP